MNSELYLSWRSNPIRNSPKIKATFMRGIWRKTVSNSSDEKNKRRLKTHWLINLSLQHYFLGFSVCCCKESSAHTLCKSGENQRCKQLVYMKSICAAVISLECRCNVEAFLVLLQNIYEKSLIKRTYAAIALKSTMRAQNTIDHPTCRKLPLTDKAQMTSPEVFTENRFGQHSS